MFGSDICDFMHYTLKIIKSMLSMRLKALSACSSCAEDIKRIEEIIFFFQFCSSEVAYSDRL